MAPELRLRVAIGVAAAVGLAIAAYLSITEASGELPQCIAGESGCATVATSDYADLAGVPVAYIGFGGYVLIAASALLAGDLGRAGGAFLALVGFGFSAYLTFIELFEIEAICQYCVASALTMTVLLVLAAWRLLAFAGADTTTEHH